MAIQLIAEYRQTPSDISYNSKSDLGDSFKYRLASPSLEIMEKWLHEHTALRAAMIEGYQTMAAENLKLAEEDMPIVLETWPQWE